MRELLSPQETRGSGASQGSGAGGFSSGFLASSLPLLLHQHRFLADLISFHLRFLVGPGHLWGRVPAPWGVPGLYTFPAPLQSCVAARRQHWPDGLHCPSDVHVSGFCALGLALCPPGTHCPSNWAECTSSSRKHS